MRVLVDYRPALRERSGVGEYTHELVRALAAATWDSPSGGFPRNGRAALELTLFSSSWKDRLDTGKAFGSTRTVDRRVPVSLLNFAWHRLAWPPAEWLAGGAFDVTHSLHPLILPSRRAAHVVTIHDLDFLTHPERTRGEIRRDYPALARAHAHRADAVIVVSAFTAAEVERRFELPRQRISICPPGAPPWTPRTSAPEHGYLLFFGTLEPRKNVGGLLDAYERLAARRRGVPELVLAGKATTESRPWIARLGQPPLAGRVRHVGYIDPSQRKALYEGACCLIQPSFEEGFGLPVLEAMTVGVPVIATNSGALPEVVGDAGPLVTPGAADALAASIERMIDDRAYADLCVARGHARARHFSWAETARRVYETYERAIDAHRRRRA